ncbi:unnamed protein product, partial [Amoebophrya sp. A25]
SLGSALANEARTWRTVSDITKACKHTSVVQTQTQRLKNSTRQQGRRRHGNTSPVVEAILTLATRGQLLRRGKNNKAT